MHAKQPLQLAPGHLHRFGQHLGIERLLGVALHLANHLHQLLVADAIAAGDLHALVVLSLADTSEHELLRHLHRQFTTVGLGNQVEHQVDRSGATGTGDAPPIDLEQLLGRLQARVILLERLQRLPVHGGAVAVEQASLGQHHRASINATQNHPLMVQAA